MTTPNRPRTDAELSQNVNNIVDEVAKVRREYDGELVAVEVKICPGGDAFVSEICLKDGTVVTPIRPQTDEKGDAKMTKIRPKTECIMCRKPTNYWTETDGKLTGFSMGMCPECVQKTKENRLEGDAKVTDKRPKTHCITCGELTNFFTETGGIAGWVCPDCDAKVTENDYVSDCETCGDPIDYCQGHGEIA